MAVEATGLPAREAGPLEQSTCGFSSFQAFRSAQRRPSPGPLLHSPPAFPGLCWARAQPPPHPRLGPTPCLVRTCTGRCLRSPIRVAEKSEAGDGRLLPRPPKQRQGCGRAPQPLWAPAPLWGGGCFLWLPQNTCLEPLQAVLPVTSWFLCSGSWCGSADTSAQGVTRLRSRALLGFILFCNSGSWSVLICAVGRFTSFFLEASFSHGEFTAQLLASPRLVGEGLSSGRGQSLFHGPT